MNNQFDYAAVTTLVNKLFVYTDEQNWDGLIGEVFTEKVELDMTSLGGVAETMTSQAIAGMWAKGFDGLDAINHLGGNYLINTSGDTGEVFTYATATHYKADAAEGTTRTFVGTYNLGIEKINDNWKINSFKYNLKYMTGNIELK
ncbi:MAG: nuclear transport factor 2 family protein [Bacteroidota bacterium]